MSTTTTDTITAEQRTERLRRLRRLVARHPAHRLHMRSFCEPASCGTAYCAAGLAAANPWFRENTDIGRLFSLDVATGVVDLVGFVPSAPETLAVIFGLSPRDAERLFAFHMHPALSAHAVTKKEVLANIDRLLRGEPAERYAASLDPAWFVDHERPRRA